MPNTNKNSFMSQEVKSKIDLDLLEKTKLDWDTPMDVEDDKEWLQFGFKQIDNPDLNSFTPFIESARYILSIWSEKSEKGYAIKYDVNYSLKSSGSNGFSLTYFYDLNGNFIKQLNR